jgi:hypothetical protein
VPIPPGPVVLPDIDPTRQAELAPPPDKAGMARVMAFQLGMEVFKGHVQTRLAELERMEGTTPEAEEARGIGINACKLLMGHADNVRSVVRLFVVVLVMQRRTPKTRYRT